MKTLHLTHEQLCDLLLADSPLPASLAALFFTWHAIL